MFFQQRVSGMSFPEIKRGSELGLGAKDQRAVESPFRCTSVILMGDAHNFSIMVDMSMMQLSLARKVGP